MIRRLHLLGEDSDDLAIISACLQDAVTCRADMAFVMPQGRFAMVLNRFRWEAELDGDGEPERIRTGLHFDHVRRVRSRGLGSLRKRPLELLALQVEDSEDASLVLLHFSGGACILLEVECLDCQLHDLSAPWGARCVPRHDGDGA
jgi:hypothetical protein